jgi:uroporphyrinogen-III synthase
LILITRPYRDGIELSKILETKFGLSSIAIPAIDIIAKSFDLPDFSVHVPASNIPSSAASAVSDSDRIMRKICILTSKNAAASIKKDPEKRRFLVENSLCIAVGKATAKTAEKLGFSDIISVDGNMYDIIDYLMSIESEWDHYDALLHLTSPYGRLCDELPLALKEKIDCHNVICYDVQPSRDLASINLDHLYGLNIQQFIFFSTLSAKIFLDYISRCTYTGYIRDIQCICLSEQVAAMAKSMGAQHVMVAEQPNIDSMIQTIIGVNLCQKSQ